MTTLSHRKRASHWVLGLVLLTVGLVVLRVGIPIYRHRQTLQFLASIDCSVMYENSVNDVWWQKSFVTKIYNGCFPSAVFAVFLSGAPRQEVPRLMKALETLPELRGLYLHRVPVEDSDLAILTKFKHLQRLDLAKTPVTDMGLVHLEQLTELQTLNLSATKVGDAGLIHLQHLENLSELILDGTLITNVGLQHLMPLRKLTSLTLSNTGVTDAGVGELHDHLPGLEVSDD